MGSSGKGTINEGSDAAGSGVLPVHNAKVHRKSGKAARGNKDLLKAKKAKVNPAKQKSGTAEKRRRQKAKITTKKKNKVSIKNNNSNKQKNKRKKRSKMITVIAIFAIVITLVASELYLVYSNYKETAELKIINEKTKKLNYSSR